MKAFTRIWAWFYDYPDFDVTELELAALNAIAAGATRCADLQVKVGLANPEFAALLERLRGKRLLARHRDLKIPVVSALGMVDVSAHPLDLRDPGFVSLSVPGRKLLRHRAAALRSDLSCAPR